jgi:hypothetical protein
MEGIKRDKPKVGEGHLLVGVAKDTYRCVRCEQRGFRESFVSRCPNAEARS